MTWSVTNFQLRDGAVSKIFLFQRYVNKDRPKTKTIKISTKYVFFKLEFSWDYSGVSAPVMLAVVLLGSKL